MSSSRSKRKRADGDTTAMAASAPSRRRGREPRSGAEPIDPAAPKNEGGRNSSNVSVDPATLADSNIGESSASGSSGAAAAPQHAETANAIAKERDKAGSTAEQASHETAEEKKRESEPDAPTIGVGNGNPSTVTSTSATAMVNQDPALRISPTGSASLSLPEQVVVPGNGGDESPTTTDANKGGTSGDTRESQMRAMISHRKLLLDRVRGGRSAARSRIVDMARSEAQASKIAMGDPSKGNAAAPAKAVALSEKARDEAEIAGFKKMTKSALQAAKKQRAENNESGQQEKRSSVSLRKGASVGKNMKAALSSLVPGGAGSSSSVPASVSSSQALRLATAGAKAAAHPGQATSISAQRPNAHAAARLPGQHTGLPLPTKKLKSSNQLTQAMNQTRMQGDAADPMLKVARSGSQKNMKLSSTANAARGMPSSAQPAASLPVHAGLAAPGLPTNRLARPPVVICPEAVALRERRNAIRSKLLDHFQERQKRIGRAESLGQDSSYSPLGTTTTTQSTTPDDAKQSISAASLAMTTNGPKPASYLPRRRKTHWDNLLEEMKWMATDFLEERKWKISAARTLGSALHAPGVKVVKHRIEEASPMRVADEPSGQETVTQEANGQASPKTEDSNDDSQESRAKALGSGSYSEPTTDETKSSKKVAQIISNMAHELGSATVQACALSQSDRVHTKALGRHRAARKGIEQVKDDGKGSATTSHEEASRDDDKSAAENAAEGNYGGNGDAKDKTGEEPKDKSGSFKRISKAVEALLETSSKKARKNTKRGKAGAGGKGDGGDLSLTTWQLETTEFIEKKWGSSNGPGAILAGPRASGKTVAACSLIWKRRTHGPQLLVCSPYRVMNWKHELKRFKNLRIRTFGFSGGISSPFSDDKVEVSFEPNEVVICEYSSLHRLKQPEFSRFETLVIDCRYPRGFHGSRRLSAFDGDAPENSANATKVPIELISESWWENLVEAAAKCSFNRLVVEHPLQETLLTNAVDKSEMQRVELVALRAAFVLGAQVFASPTSSVKKRILTWARRRTKETVESTKNKIEEVQDFLVDLVHPFYCPEKSDGFLELVSHTEGKRFDAETRPCSLSKTERSEYEKCCAALRGALSFDINRTPESSVLRSQTLSTISEALLRLRRQCIHTELAAVLESAPVRSRLGSYAFPKDDGAGLSTAAMAGNRILCRKVTDSASQADSDLASRILRGSAKLRELVSMLRNECEYIVEGDDALDDFLEPEKGRRGKQGIDRKPAKDPKKVVILAVLPEVQIIISVLLNCIGVAHELLLRPSRFFNPSQLDITLSLPENQANASTLAWIECQQALSRFNSPATSTSAVNTTIVITSPDIVAGDHGGIGIDMADIIISVDEDWSGRDELIMRSLVAGLIPRNLRTVDKGCEFIRLICENTCEEIFLSLESDESSGQSQEPSDSDAWPWRIDSYGRFDSVDASSHKVSHPRRWPWREQEEEMFAFPAVNLLRFRNKSLSEVLAIEEGLPPLLDNGAPVLFLPRAIEGDATDAKSAELKLVVRLMETEELTHTVCKEAGVRTTSPSSFHGDAMTRQDLSTIAIRMYLEHSGKSLVMKHLPSTAGHAVSSGGSVASSAIPAASALHDAADISDTWQIDGRDVSPVDFASSLLFYSPQIGDTNKQAQQGLLSTGAGRENETAAVSAGGHKGSRGLPLRANNYVDAFNLFLETNVRDGKQGSEALVYFPPLFPSLQRCSLQAQRDIEAIRARNARRFASGDLSLPLTSSSVQEKRPADTSEDPLAKRLKVEDPALLPAGFTSSSNAHSAAAMAVVPAAAPVITEDEASHSDAATVLLDLDEDFGLIGVGAIPLPRDSAVASSTTSVEVSSRGLDPDHVPLQSDWSDEQTPCDTEELDSFRVSQPDGLSLGSVILFVGRKKQRQLMSLPGAAAPIYRPPTSLLGVDPSWAGAAVQGLLPGPGNGVIRDMNGSGSSTKKSKKKALIPTSSAAFVPGSHPMSQMPMNVQILKAKDMYRSRILSFLSSRQKAMGMTMFESSAYCVAAVRFRNRVNDRMQNASLNSPMRIATGVPLLAKDAASFSSYAESERTLWTSIVKRLKTQDSATGDDARALAESQRSALRRSLSAPCRVDFGPFHGGFLPSLSGMTGISPPRSRIGVSLPMGVKVPPVLPQQQQYAWSEREDQQLQDCTARYGMNWILAARMLTGFDDVLISSTPSRTDLGGATAPARSHHQRSARNCRDRWQSLARVDPLLAKEVRKTERVLRESTSMDSATIPEEARGATRLAAPELSEAGASDSSREHRISFLFPSDSIQDAIGGDKVTVLQSTTDAEVENSSNMDVDGAEMKGSSVLSNLPHDDINKMDVDKPKKPKKSYGSLMVAMAKVQIIPMTIPGVVPGSQPSFVASHPSHTQSVQSSVAATWTNGKTEMWPLQFLDVAEKHRARAASAAAAAPASSSRSRPQKAGGQGYASPGRKAPPPQHGSPYHPQAAAPHVAPSRSPRHHHHDGRTPGPPSAAPYAAVPHPGVPHPKYATHTPVTHSQQHQANAKPRVAPASTARPSSANKSPTKNASSRSPPATSPPSR